jgi:hypothetical protein
MTTRRTAVLAGLIALSLSTVGARESPTPQPPTTAGEQGGRGLGRGQRQAARDRAVLPRGTSTISGRVLAADTGRPVKRARVSVTAAAGGGRGGGLATSDDQGRYVVTDLAAGTYSVRASKSGFVDALFGQRRPLQPGTPVQVADGQAAANVDLRLTRGGVITGRIVDEDGEPLARALVTVQRYQYVRGERQLTAESGGATDDRGQYRVFGLPPAEYYVSATASGLAELLGGFQQLAIGLGALDNAGRGGGRGVVAGTIGGALPQESTGYAPTYYPGVVNAPEASKIKVGAGQEVAGIDFQILLVPLATVSGVVVGAQDAANVLLVPDGSGAGVVRVRDTFASRARADGAFSIRNVPPGRYKAVARSGGRGGEPRTGIQPVVVNGQPIEGLTLVLQPGVTLSGNFTVESSGTPAPTDYSVFRVEVPELDPLPGGGTGRGGPFGGRGVEKNGSFAIANLQPGLHYIRVTGGAQGQGQALWTVKAINVAGQDVADSAIELKPGENVENVTIILSDRTTEISGTVRDPRNAGTAAISVIAFSSDPSHWRPQSRRIQAVRTDQSGAFRLRNLPPGDYFLLATDDVEQGEWFDPAFLENARSAAQRISLSEGDKKTQDLRGPG